MLYHCTIVRLFLKMLGYIPILLENYLRIMELQ